VSAKINIETDDPALAAALGMLIAKAITDAGFKNSMAKHVVVMNKVKITNSPEKFHRFNEASLHLREPIVEEMGREPPILGPLYWMAPPNDIVNEFQKRNPYILENRIVMSTLPDTSSDYEAAVANYLKPVVDAA
jgi:hypothetical protein